MCPAQANRRTFPRLAAACLVALLLVTCLAGCVRRRMTIRTNPPGAVVYVDDYEIGATPVSTNFTHYGTRRIRIAKDGYETLTVEQPIPAPWYEIPPLDFFAETLVPTEIRDHRTLNYQLVPQRVVPPDQLRARAEDLRARANAAATGLPAVSSASPYPTAAGAGIASPRATAPPATGPVVIPPAAVVPPPGPVAPPPGPAAPSTGGQGAYPYPSPAPRQLSLPPGALPPGALPPGVLPPGVLPPSASPRDAGPQTLPPGGIPLR